MVEDAGRRVASVSEARALMGLDPLVREPVRS
jgi:hypothetical protein